MEPLFYVACTTCEARLRFFNEDRVGQIVPCPKCGSMVHVVWEKDVEDAREEQAPTPQPPAPPPNVTPPPPPDVTPPPAPEPPPAPATLELPEEFNLDALPPAVPVWKLAAMMAAVAGVVAGVLVGVFMLLRGGPDGDPVAAAPDLVPQIVVEPEPEVESEPEVEPEVEPEESLVELPPETADIPSLTDIPGLTDVPEAPPAPAPGIWDDVTPAAAPASGDSAELPEIAPSEAETPETPSEPEGLQFTRRPRGSVYAGDDILPETLTGAGSAPTPGSAPTHGFVPQEVASPQEVAGASYRRAQVPAVPLPEEIAQKFSVPVEKVEFSGLPLSSVLRFAAESAGVRVVQDWQKLEKLGVTPKTEVSISLENVTLREAVGAALAECDLALVPSGKTLKLVGLEVAEVMQNAEVQREKPVKRSLELEDLAGRRLPNSGAADVVELIARFVHPALWDACSGPGKLVSGGRSTKISVLQYPSVLREVEFFCEKLRRARKIPLKSSLPGQGATRRQVPDGSEMTDSRTVTRMDLSRELLARKLNLDLSDGVTLREAVEEVFRAAGGSVFFEEEAVSRVPVATVLKDLDVPDFQGNRRAAPGSALDIRVVYQFDGVTVEEAVAELLRGLPVVCYPLDDKRFLVTTASEARRKLLVEFFAVGDILQSESKAGKFIDIVRQKIAPDSWLNAGGRGDIYFDLPSRTLIVIQSPMVLHQLDQFLIRYRATERPTRVEGP